MFLNNLGCYLFYSIEPYKDPIKILQRKFYATQFFIHSDWLLKFINQTGSLKLA